MRKQKFLAALLALVMVLTLLPVTAFADDGVAPVDAQENGLYMTKSATLEDNGTYTINLEAYVTGTVKVETSSTAKATDIVLVMDMSGSMRYPINLGNPIARANADTTKGATTGYYCINGGAASDDTTTQWRLVRYYNSQWQYLVGGTWYNIESYSSLKNKSLYECRFGAMLNSVEIFTAAAAAQNAGLADDAAKHRIALVTFEDGAETLLPLTVVDDAFVNTISAAIETATADLYGYTNSAAGLENAQALFTNNESRAQAVVMLSDGYPSTTDTFNYEIAAAAIRVAGELKADDTRIYTVNVMDTADISDVSAITTSSDADALMNTYMNAVSSNYPNATATGSGGMGASGSSYSVALNGGSDEGYYKKAMDAAALERVFGEIYTSITGSANFDLGDEAILKDVMNAGFTLANASASVAVYDYTGNGGWTLGTDSLTATVDKANETVSVTGFSYKDNYVAEATSATDARGKKVVVTITGVVPTDAAVTNDYISTNAATSGMYSGETLVEPFLNPTTILTSHAYVVDYAKPFDIDKADWLMNSVSTYVQTMGNISGVSISELEMAYGKLVGTTYTPQTMNWDGDDSFYAFGTSSNETVTAADANENGNLWSKVSIIPANNVYYEDDFITSAEDGTVGFEYGSGWTVEYSDSTSDNKETADTDVHGGWQNGDLADDDKFSDGSAHKVSQKAKASFTFTGTGVDVYTYTDAQSGGIRATLSKWNEEKSSWDMLMVQYMDNLAASGEYYQIPTLSLHSVTGSDLAGNTVDTPLTYGKYKVDLIAYAIDGNATYYLDGIRIYNPAQEAENDTEDTTVSDAYEENNALKAVFTEVRDILLDNNSFTSGETSANGVVFIDDDDTAVGTTTSVIGTYADYGPKNEVYLAKGQAIAFVVGQSEGAHYFVGLKAPEGSTTAKVTHALDGNNASELTIGHSTDLYYEIIPNDDGYIIIENTTDNLLSVTKLQTTGTGDADLLNVNTNSLLAYANEFDSLPVVAYSLRTEPEVEETVPEETVPEETVPEETVPEETEPEVDVEIENPEPTPEEKPAPTIKDLIEKIFGFIRKWF